MAESILFIQQGASEQIGLREAPLIGWNAADGCKGSCPVGIRQKEITVLIR